MAKSSFFSDASKAAEEWLDSVDGVLLTRLVSPGAAKRPRVWVINTENDPIFRGTKVCLSLPRDFPASAPRVKVDKNFCLLLPHVEEDGKVCLGVDPEPQDYDYPIGVVRAVLEAFDKLMEQWRDPKWVDEEFQRERLSYWARFCDRKRSWRHAVKVAKKCFVGLPSDRKWQDGKATLYAQDNVAVLSATAEPTAVARRHDLARGTVLHGHALFVPMSEDEIWTPATWPRHVFDLTALVRRLTSGECNLPDWILSHQKKKRPAPFFVVLMQETVTYAYQLAPSLVERLTLPNIEPLWVTRIDAAWSLSRDQNPLQFANHQAMKVLLLGAGSLGSAVAELLARAGTGSLDIVDCQGFDPENTSRHVLGLKDIQNNKASALASKIYQEIPDIKVNGICAMIAPWIVDQVRQGSYDIVIDCSGERSIRRFLSIQRSEAFGNIPIVHAWLEPFGAGSHVVVLNAADTWPESDPIDLRINTAAWDHEVRVNLPACGAGFHPYGMSDVFQASAYVVEHVLNAYAEPAQKSSIYSVLRTREFLTEHGAGSSINLWVPEDIPGCTSRSIKRDFNETVSGL